MNKNTDEMLVIDPTDKTPKIVFDTAANIFEISGCSLPDNAVTFYTPVLKWLSNKENTKASKLELTLRMDYFNTATSKMILEILKQIDVLKNKGWKVSIKWTYDDDDEDIMEAGKIYAGLFDFPFILFPVAPGSNN